MSQTLYLSLEEVLELHKRTIKIHGGSFGVRDQGLLESALYRCQSGYYQTLAEQGAALMQSLCMNHCFVDGNKRIALLATFVFFRINGQRIDVSNDEIVAFIVNKLIKKSLEVNDIANWLGQRLVPR